MKHARLLLLLAIGLALLLACSEHSQPRFPHDLHLTELKCGGPGLPDCLSCATCHHPKQGNRTAALPKVDVCQRCHKPTDQQALAAVNRPPQDPEPLAYGIRFFHAKHLAMPGNKGQCVPCHAGIVEKSEPRFPTMARCFTCHEHQKQWDEGVCTPCHQSADLSQLMPQTFLRHDAGFVTHRHGVLARQKQAICQNCHSQQQCDDCHDVSQGLSIEKRRPDSIERRLVHRGDFLTRHPIEAKSQPTRCLKCHTVETCDSCHVKNGVSGNAIRGANPHPPGWVGGNTDGRSFHGRAARRDIVACAACHDQGPATNCIRCHKVGAYGGNPHPNGWKSSRSDGAAMCRYCHEQ
ncbi:MAG: hypothetical protein KC776_17980 [Myxococcales bacterium]|nr:hypothetical protein [Myxococcales bacterium]MCB9575435.1 hypothetical protein [Polyangiaceae bacterium]